MNDLTRTLAPVAEVWFAGEVGAPPVVRKESSTRFARPWLRFVFSSLSALIILSAITFFITERLGRREALERTQESVRLLTNSVVVPVVEPALFQMDRAAIAKLDVIVKQRLISKQIRRVKIWDPGGTVVYCDDSHEIGSRFELGSDENYALTNLASVADVSTLGKIENTFEKKFGRLLEVYQGVEFKNGQRALVEMYFDAGAVAGHRNRLLKGLIPLLLGSLFLLQLVQLPFVRTLANTIRSAHSDRERLLQRAIEAGDIERRKIASDLHDAVIQNLTGLSFFLAASAAKAKLASRALETADATANALATKGNGSLATVHTTKQTTDEIANALDESGKRLRSEIESLRSFVVDIYPPDLGEEGGLARAIGTLLQKFESQGIHTSISHVGPEVGEQPAQLLYRVAKEALINVNRHAKAKNIRVDIVSAQTNGADERAITTLTVADDGIGFEMKEAEAAKSNGSVGLRALRGMVNDHGGRMVIESTPGIGTSVLVAVHAR